MGISLTNTTIVSKSIIKVGPTLNNAQQITLYAEVIDKEISKSLSSIVNDEAPGVYGYNSVFLKRAWLIIKQDITDTV